MTDTHDTITNEPLKPCPFCGGKASAIEVLNYNATAVRCDKCHASSGNCDTEEEAIAAWNRRDGEVAWKREMNIEELEDVLAEMDGECGEMDNGTITLITLNEERYRSYIQRIRDAALAAPPRNCDVGTAAEQSKRFCAFCRPRLEPCDGCSCLEGARYGRCEFVWGQMPYEEDKTKGEGDVRK